MRIHLRWTEVELGMRADFHRWQCCSSGWADGVEIAAEPQHRASSLLQPPGMRLAGHGVLIQVARLDSIVLPGPSVLQLAVHVRDGLLLHHVAAEDFHTPPFLPPPRRSALASRLACSCPGFRKQRIELRCRSALLWAHRPDRLAFLEVVGFHDSLLL